MGMSAWIFGILGGLNGVLLIASIAFSVGRGSSIDS